MKKLFLYFLLCFINLNVFPTNNCPINSINNELTECTETSNTGASVIVTNTNDVGPGTLREALLMAQADPTIDSILFNIPGSGVQTIQIFSSLPSLPGIVIDGTSQPGNFPMAGLIEIDANGIPASLSPTILFGNGEIYGLVINGGSRAIRGASLIVGAKDRGNVIYNCSTGIDILPSISRISYNIIGSDINYQNPLDINDPNYFSKVLFSGIVLGNTDSTLVENNTILNSFFRSIWLSSSKNSMVSNNYIGVDSSFTMFSDQDMFGIHTGIQVVGGNDQTIQNNFITLQDTAVSFTQRPATTEVAIRNSLVQNSIYCNQVGVIIYPGNQQGIVEPTIIQANLNLISGTAQANETIEVYVETQSNNWTCSDCDAGAYQGETYLGTVFTDAVGNWTLDSSNFQTFLMGGQNVTATATDSNGNTSEFSSCFPVDTTVIDNSCLIEIPLQAGWNLISSNCEPNELVMDSVFSEISGNTLQVKNLADTYIPSFGFNNIGDWNMASSYQVKMLTDDTLKIEGTKVDPLNTPLFLQSGWNLGAYLLDAPSGPFSTWADISPNVVQIKDLTGTFIPSFNFSDIDTIYPYEGFQFKMLNADTLIYDPNNVGF